MIDASRKFAVHSASDGRFYPLYRRKAVEGHEGVAATTYPIRLAARYTGLAGRQLLFWAKPLLSAGFGLDPIADASYSSAKARQTLPVDSKQPEAETPNLY